MALLPPLEDLPLWDTWLSQWVFPTITVSVELGLFNLLDTTPGLQTAEIAQKLSLGVRGTQALLDVATGSKYLTRTGGRYYLSPSTRTFLVQSKHFYWGDMLLGDKFSQPHDALKKAIEADKPVIGAAEAWELGELSAEKAEELTAGFQSHSAAAAAGMTAAFDFAAEGITKLLDVGGGSGCFSIAIAKKFPSISVTIMELPVVCPIAERYVRNEGMSTQVTTRAVNMFTEPWPQQADGFDAVFFSNVFHDWTDAQNLHLAKSALGTLRPGGRIVLHEILIADDRSGPLTASLFSMHMLVYTRGKQYTFLELSDLLTTAGFTDVRVLPTYGYYSVVIANRP